MKELICILLLLGFSNGCSAYKQFEGVNKTYLEDVDTSKKLSNMPFAHSWVWNEVDRSKYKSLYVAPVRTDTIDASNWEENMSPAITTKEQYMEECRQVADYFRQQLQSEIENYPDSQFSLAGKPGPGVAVISIALTEVVFNHPVANAGTLVAPIGTGAALSAMAEPHAAFALRLTDGKTNKLIATAADRKFPPMRLLDLNKFTVTSPIREVSANWSKEIADSINKGRFAKVEQRGWATLMPW